MDKLSAKEVYKELLKSETVSLVVEHELHGVTPKMLDWWWDNLDNDNYKLWKSKDHIALEWQIPPSQVGHVGAIHMACESISDLPPQILRIRWEDPRSALITPIYGHVNVGSSLAPGTADIPLGSLVHEYEETAFGARMRSHFILPAMVPPFFLDFLKKHNQAEMGRFSEFLPQLYKQKTV